MSDDNYVGVVIVAERSNGGDAGLYQKFSFPYLDPAENNNDEEREGEGGERNKEDEEKEDG